LRETCTKLEACAWKPVGTFWVQTTSPPTAFLSVTVSAAVVVSSVTFKSVVSAVLIKPYAKDGNNHTNAKGNKYAKCRTKRVLLPASTRWNGAMNVLRKLINRLRVLIVMVICFGLNCFLSFGPSLSGPYLS